MQHAVPAKKATNKKTSLDVDQASAYLHLLKKTLTRYPFDPGEQVMLLGLNGIDPPLVTAISQWAVDGQSAGERNGFIPSLRAIGLEWPANAETMIGLSRLNNIEHCVINVLKNDVPGDVAETGVWRGGAAIFMRAVLKAYGDLKRKVWLADSFQGLPKPDVANYPADFGNSLWTFDPLAVSLEKVQANFARYALLDDQVRFVKGWFRDTLPTAPIDKLAVLRLDGDMYESTIVALRSLYPKVSPGGFVIIDDYGCVPACRQAVDDFRAKKGIVETLSPIDWTGVYWQRLLH